MKRLLTAILTALLFASSVFAGEKGYRANFYVPGKYEPGTKKVFVWHSLMIANSESEVRSAIYEIEPNAVIKSVKFLGEIKEIDCRK
jgi:hypothetical protein